MYKKGEDCPLTHRFEADEAEDADGEEKEEEDKDEQ
jgi:hypothetical protein